MICKVICLLCTIFIFCSNGVVVAKEISTIGIVGFANRVEITNIDGKIVENFKVANEFLTDGLVSCEKLDVMDISPEVEKYRIKYEELFMYMLKINYLKNKIENDNNAIRVENEKAELLVYVPRYYAEAFVRLMVEKRINFCNVMNVDMNHSCDECIEVMIRIFALISICAIVFDKFFK
mgnify:CR=1 FL=1